jgi:DUF1009 family protein
MDRLGLVAGAGALPLEILRACQAADRPVVVARLKGLADPALEAAPGFEAGVGELGKIMKGFKKAGCARVCFAGRVPRPDFATLRADLRGVAALPAVIAAARKGDDAILRQILSEFERDGFVIEGPDQVVGDLTIGEGALGRIKPSQAHQADIDKAMAIARAMGKLDIGQAAVVIDGRVLAVEAQEGTDALLARCAELNRGQGRRDQAAGVLAKAPKPIQDRRVDLPTIGPATIMAAARAGLAGVVGEAGGLLVVDRAAVIQAADDLGLFVFGVERAQ